MRVLTQVVLAYLVVSGTFCFPGITSSTVSPGLVFKNPGLAPKDALSCGVRVRDRACCWSRAGLSRGLVGSPAPTSDLVLGHTLSERRGSRPCPTGFLSASVDVTVGWLPRRSVLFPHPSFVCVWDRASVPLPAHLSRTPCPSCNLPSQPPPGVSPSRRKACLLR